ncbi:HsdM family class I SAM-dependent methyltransferase [Priestia megaterium]|uniref:HsdM family class I SAM-dependent methyltransferase n=1 Tax=Priestia megaterium TaxID=1404 RepID=UPI00301D9D76
MAKKKRKQEALTVTRLINEILIGQLRIPLHQIVNDKTFTNYTFMKRPDLLISNIGYDIVNDNEDEYIANLVAYAEIKDNCSLGDKEWQDAYNQGLEKSKKLGMPYFIVTNCDVVYFYNNSNGQEIKLNGNPIREFQNIDILNLINKRLQKDRNLTNITTNVDLQSAITETIFNKKLWDLANIYRQVDFKNVTEKIDFTIGFISLKFFEEKEEMMGELDKTNVYWSDINKLSNNEIFVASLISYIERLEEKTEFSEFINLMEVARKKIKTIPIEDTRDIFNVVEGMNRLHGCGFDLFGAVYEMFASNKEKSDFGEFFTRRHYTHVFSKLLLANEKSFIEGRHFTILDPACGTGGFLTEAFKFLQNQYTQSGTLTEKSLKFLRYDCLYGIDVREENVSRTKLNMFLVGDGHTNIVKENTLKVTQDKKGTKNEDVLDRLSWNQFDYVLTNPPYGNGTIKAETSSLSTIRFEIAFLAKIIKMLKVGGKACVIVPDGIFENPSYAPYRKELLEKVEINSIVSLPKFAFAPYTKEKTYALFFEKKSPKNTKVQNQDIWMYIIDNDGFANSDKRFVTKLKNKDGSWRHDEISSWVDTSTGDEMLGLMEKRWMKFTDMGAGTSWIDEKGEVTSQVKGGYIEMSEIKEENYFNLLPEYHLRKIEPDYITFESFDEELNEIEKALMDAFSQVVKEND